MPRMSRSQSTTQAPFPGFLVAAAMTLVAWWAQFAWALLAARWASPQIALLTAFTMGCGLTGLLAATRLESPKARRLGLRSMAARFTPVIVLLVPLAILALEAQATVRGLFHRHGARGVWEWGHAMIASRSTLALIGSFVLLVVLIPALTEWFFRGVIHQGLVQKLGAWRGVLLGALLYAVWTAGLRPDAGTWLGVMTGGLILAVALGAVRQASGSLVAPFLLHAAWNAAYILMSLIEQTAPIPVLTAPGRHVPVAWLLPSAIAVAGGVFALHAAARRARAAP